MAPDLDEVRRRLIRAMDLNEDVHEHWLETAECQLEAYRHFCQKKRVYDISTTGARIRTAREVLGLTQEQVAQTLGISTGEVTRFENGKKPIRAERLMRLSRSLGVKDAWLLMESDEGGPALPTKVLRRQHLRNWQALSNKEKKKHKAKVELDRLRGLRTPDQKRPKGAM